jgi:hypothetical protein
MLSFLSFLFENIQKFETNSEILEVNMPYMGLPLNNSLQ